MKTTLHSTARTFALCMALCLALLASACQSSVDGQVFFDGNGNGSIDSSETGVPFAKLMVSRDGNLVAEQYADGQGRFNVPIKSRAGYLCIEADLSYAESKFGYIMQMMGAEPAGQVLAVKPPKALMTPSAEDEEVEGEETAEEETEIITTTPSMPDGWSTGKYCRNVKFKGFEVDVPVSVSFEAALEEMPSRLAVDCYAGESCEVRIAYPEGCTLKPLTLPDGLTLDTSKSMPAVESFDKIFNIVRFRDVQASPEKAQTSGLTFSVSGFTMITLYLKADSDVDIGTTELELKPVADCMGEDLELEEVPINVIREISVAVYQHLATTLGSSGTIEGGSDVTIIVIVENRGKSEVTKGDITFTFPTGSILGSAIADCLNYGDKLVCRVESIAAGETFQKSIQFKIPSPATDTSVSCEASFITPEMEAKVSADPVTFIIGGSS